MKKVTLYLFLIIGITNYSQGFRTHYFSQTAFDNRTQSIFELPNGNYFGGGVVLETVNGRTRFSLQLVGLNAFGNVIWEKKYSHPTLDYGSTPLVYKGFYKTATNIYFAGAAIGTSLPQLGVLFKFNFNGDSIWRKIIPSDSTEDILPQIVTQGVDGGLLITGWYQNWTTGTRPGLIMKTDANGNELWRKRIHKTIIDVSDGKAIIQDSATKKIVIVGSQYIGPNSNSYSNKHNILILDSLGNKISQTSYPVDGALMDLIQTKDKYFVAAGGIAGNRGYSYLIKFDVNNPSQPIWRIDNFGPFVQRNGFTTLTEMPNGDIMTAGGIDTTDGYELSVRLSRFKSNGSHLKTKYYQYRLVNTNLNGVYLTSLNVTSDGGLIAAVWANNINVINPFLFVKFDTNGCDTSLAACSNLVGVNELSPHNFWDENEKFKIYPNPAGEIINVECSILNGLGINDVRIKIADVSGRELENNTLQNDAKLSINTSQYQTGIYFVTLFYNGNATETKKLMIVR